MAKEIMATGGSGPHGGGRQSGGRCSGNRCGDGLSGGKSKRVEKVVHPLKRAKRRLYYLLVIINTSLISVMT